MLNQFSKLAGILVISSLGLALSPIKSTQAAELTKEALFYFSLNEFNTRVGFGSLSFSYTGQELTGRGTETIKLSELLNSEFSFGTDSFTPSVAFPNPESISFGFDGGDPIFTFESGLLVGIDYQTQPQSFSFSDGRYCDFDGGCSQGEGDLSLVLEGDQYSVGGSLTGREYNIYGELLGESTYSIGATAGTIIFDQIIPVESQPIPEPLSILGLGTAIGFGSYFKRKISQKK